MSQETCQLTGAHMRIILSVTEVVMLNQKTGSLLSIDSGKRIPTAIFAALSGAMLFYFAAFAHSDILHNSTHDTRHAIVAPCH